MTAHRGRIAVRLLCVACGRQIHDPDMTAKIILCTDCASAPVTTTQDSEPPDHGSRATMRACPAYRNKRCTRSGRTCLILTNPPSRCPDLAPVIAREVLSARCRYCRTPLRPGKQVCRACQKQKRRVQMRVLMARRRGGAPCAAAVSEKG